MKPHRVIDAHVHFWDPSVLRYPWLDDAPSLRRAFLPADFTPLATGAVDGVLFVEANCQPAQSQAECDFVDALAANEPRITGIIAYVDLLDETHRTLALDSLCARKRVVGIRHNIQGNTRGFCLQPAFARGVQDVTEHGLPFDLCITAEQLPDVIELVGRCPDTSFVLDHCGKPAIAEDALEPWASQLAQLAHHPNVACKLSGLLSEARPDQRNERGILPYARHAMACFGADRMMYGSDWPVVTTAGTEPAWRSLVDAFVSTWSPDERRAFFADNASRIYGLGTVELPMPPQ